ncbi:MAG: hypothetical protein P1U39_02265 [Legionellaceae bacterium]|nr:hypothetical protein [Legionellaceae bacterium]
MRATVRIMVVACALLGLLSCTSNPKDVAEAQEKRACEQICLKNQQSCLRTCDDSCKACQVRENEKMEQRYKTYVDEQCEQGKRVALQLQSFRDPLQCRKSSCDCPADYRVCMSACAGPVYKRLQVTPVCC